MILKIWTVANLITVLRVLLIPFVIICFYYGVHGAPKNQWIWWSISLFLLTICELTDFVDGYLARLMHQVSEFGALLDPLCDSMVRFSIFLSLSQLNIIPAWTVYVFFYRDLSVAYLRILAMAKGVVFSARISGKIKAVAQGVGIFIIVGIEFFKSLKIDILYGVISKEIFVLVIMLLVSGITIWSGLDYAYKIFSMRSADEIKK